jgi:hypothetical protein
MNQERFDELAKGLATNRLSRGQVLKGLAASLLLAGPLGALFERRAWGQTVGCVTEDCVQRGQRAYDNCKKPCKRKSGKKKRQCLNKCKSIFASQLAGCGCLTLNTDSSTQSATPAACTDLCTVKTLSDQASQDANYSVLETYLTNDGFVTDAGSVAVVFREENGTETPLLATSYSNSNRNGETADLFYFLEEDKPFGSAYIYDGTELREALIVDPEQNVVLSSSALNQASIAAQASSAGCDSTLAEKCRKDALHELVKQMQVCYAALSVACGASGAGVVRGIGGSSIACVLALGAYSWCVKIAHEDYYKRRTDCEPLGTCPAGQRCLNGECSNTCNVNGKCPDGQTCCKGVAAGVCVANCTSPKSLNTTTCTCECAGQSCASPRVLNDKTCQCECPAGQTDCGGQCVNTNVDRANCGSCGNNCFDRCGDRSEHSAAACCQGVCKTVFTVCSQGVICNRPQV